MVKKQQTLLKLIDDFEQFRFCNPDDDTMIQHQVIIGFRALVKALRRASRSITTIDLQNDFQQIRDPETLDDVYDIHADINALIPELKEECDKMVDENIVQIDTNVPLKAFISYSEVNKKIASKIKELLKTDFDIDSFLAHEDVTISQDWRQRIIDELKLRSIFIPILSNEFKRSDWTSQEIGFAFSNQNTLIIPISLDGTVSYGLIQHIQSKKINPDYISTELFLEPIIERFPHSIIPVLIKKIGKAGSYHYAEELFCPLVPHFSKFNHKEINDLTIAAIENGQVWSAALCRGDYLPKFLALHEGKIETQKLIELKYQLEHNEWYFLKDKKSKN